MHNEPVRLLFTFVVFIVLRCELDLNIYIDYSCLQHDDIISDCKTRLRGSGFLRYDMKCFCLFC